MLQFEVEHPVVHLKLHYRLAPRHSVNLSENHCSEVARLRQVFPRKRLQRFKAHGAGLGLAWQSKPLKHRILNAIKGSYGTGAP